MREERNRWLTQVANNINEGLVGPVAQEYYEVEPPKFRVTAGVAPGIRPDAKAARATCLKRELSTDNHNEIFISPELEDFDEIATEVAAMLCHAWFDTTKTTLPVRELLHAIFIENLAPSEYKSEDLAREYFKRTYDIVGAMPTGTITQAALKPKGKSRTYTVACANLDCRLSFRTSLTAARKLKPECGCPACGDQGQLYITLPYDAQKRHGITIPIVDKN